MKCKELETSGIAYLDGKLPARQRAEVGQHLASCPACRERLEGFTQVMGMLDEWESIHPSPFFGTRLAARLEEEAASRGWLGSLWRQWAPRPAGGSLIAVTLAVVMTVALVLVRYSPIPSQTNRGGQATPAVSGPSVFPVVSVGADDATLYQDMPLFEDWEVVRNFEVLQELSNTSVVPTGMPTRIPTRMQ